jgi:hypothetical protein
MNRQKSPYAFNLVLLYFFLFCLGIIVLKFTPSPAMSSASPIIEYSTSAPSYQDEVDNDEDIFIECSNVSVFSPIQRAKCSVIIGAYRLAEAAGIVASWALKTTMWFVGMHVYIDINNELIRGLWSSVRIFTNTLYGIAIIIIAFANMLRINIKEYELKIMLPRLIITVLLVNLSWLICSFIIDIGNVLTISVSNLSKFADFTKNPPDLSWASLVNSAGDIASFGGTIFFILILFVIAVILGLYLVFLMAFRVAVIWMLVAVSPIAYSLQLLPFTKKIYSQWWSTFAQWVFMGAIVQFSLSLGVILLENWTTDGPGWTKIVMLISFMAMAATAPKIIGGQIMKGATGMTSKAWKSKPVSQAKSWAWTGSTDGRGMTGLKKRFGFTDREIARQAYNNQIKSSMESIAGNRLAAGEVGLALGDRLVSGDKLRKAAIEEQRNKQRSTAVNLAKDLTPEQLANTWVEESGGIKAFVDNQGIAWDARQLANMNEGVFDKRFTVTANMSAHDRLEFDKTRRGAQRARKAIHVAQIEAGKGNVGMSNTLERLSSEPIPKNPPPASYAGRVGFGAIDRNGNIITGLDRDGNIITDPNLVSASDNYDVNKQRNYNYQRIADAGPETSSRRQLSHGENQLTQNDQFENKEVNY